MVLRLERQTQRQICGPVAMTRTPTFAYLPRYRPPRHAVHNAHALKRHGLSYPRMRTDGQIGKGENRHQILLGGKIM